MKKFNDEVYYPDEKIVRVSSQDIGRLKELALANPRKRARLCTHENIEDPVHEMLIVHTNDTYVRPHKHLQKCESFHIIEGQADVIIFDEEGHITEKILMGDFQSGKMFYYRLSGPLYHTLNIISDVIVFHEAAQGPFKPEETVYAPWAPGDDQPVEIEEFMNNIRETASSVMGK